jgi:serine/threonine protein kinase
VAAKPPVSLPENLGRYRIVKPLGQGGMGAVYLAQDTELDRQVALKIPRITAQDGSGVLDRFYREARAAATLRHPNICPVFDIGESDGVPYLTMAYIEGKSLAQFVRTKPLTQRQAATLVRKIALGLQEAHQRGVIHRDLKPANVMIDMRGEPIVMDFGLARRTGQNETRLTRDGSAIGTPAYMPPEQISTTTENMGPRCDIYSLGVMLYELLTGRLPFTGDAMAMLAQILTDDPPRPTSLQPDIDPALEGICLKAMAKKPEDRYASMGELAADLLEYLRGKTPTPQAAPTPKPQAVQTQAGINVSMLGGLRSMAQAGHDLDLPKDTRAFQRKKKRSGVRQRRGLPGWAWASIGGGALVILIVGILIVWSRKEPASEETGPNSNAIASRNTPAEKTAKQAKPSSSPSSNDGEGIPPKPVAPTVPPETKQPLAQENGWTSLFNGTDLSGWRQVGEGGGWWVKDGELFTDRGQIGPRGLTESGWLMTERDYSDFILRLEFNVLKLADTGVAFRCDPTVAYPTGQAEIQIADEQTPERARQLDQGPYRRTGSLAALAGDRTVPSLELDRWHTMTVELRGRHLKVTVNDTVTVDTDLDRHMQEAKKGQYGRAGVWRQSGPIGLQKMLTPTGVARFRKIEIKDLSSAALAPPDKPEAASPPAASKPSVPPSPDPFPRGRWVALDPAVAESWPWDPARKETFKSLENGILTLNHGCMAFPAVQARDLSIRAQVKYVSGQGAAIQVRGRQGDGGYGAWCNREPGGMFAFSLSLIDKQGAFRELKRVRRKDTYGEFLELQLTAQGDLFTVHANGEKVIEFRDSTKLRVGGPDVNAFRTRAVFKNIEVKVLD